MKKIRHLTFVLAVGCLVMAAGAFAAVAADSPAGKSSQPAVPVGSSTASSGGPAGSRPVGPEAVASMADIPENQAELEALASGKLVIEPVPATVSDPDVEAARNARRVAFDAILASQSAKIQALSDRLSASPGDQNQIQQEIAQEKKATNRLLLELQLEWAVSSGIEENITHLRAALEALDAPLPAPVPSNRPVPTNPGR